ncbi:MAG: hypothetical protein KatS3mg115_1480 [Candidatus Poribacteria bacterium]|nr:MAG: hypothetical protein KatS3mg115_1480 [Candidatus Poribacteria bacterium]
MSWGEELLYKLRLRRRPKIRRSREDVLRSIPLRHPLVEWTREETGEVCLKIPADNKRWLRFFIRVLDLPDKRVVALDEVGSFVWEQCDGEHTFGEIVEALVKRFRMTRREAEASLAEYFRLLGRRGLVGFAVPETAAREWTQRSTKTKGHAHGY